MSDTHIRGHKMENFDIYNKNLDSKKDKKKSLSNDEREAFEKELDLINRLIEENLGLSDTEIDDSTKLSTKSEDDSLKLPNNEIIQSFNDPAKLQRERLQRIGILKNDPTGKNLKASGEDV